jgi:hypothetical protein
MRDPTELSEGAPGILSQGMHRMGATRRDDDAGTLSENMVRGVPLGLGKDNHDREAGHRAAHPQRRVADAGAVDRGAVAQNLADLLVYLAELK